MISGGDERAAGFYLSLLTRHLTLCQALSRQPEFKLRRQGIDNASICTQYRCRETSVLVKEQTGIT